MKGKKTGGREKGTPNRETKYFRELVGSIIDENRDLLLDDIKALEPKDRVQTILKLLEFVTPKVSSVQAKTIDPFTLEF